MEKKAENVAGIATVGRDWRLTIPKAVRDNLGLRAGDGVDIYEKDGRFYIRKAPPGSATGKQDGTSEEMRDQ